MNRVLRCAIIDDDRSIREILKQCIKITDFLEFDSEYDSAIDARAALREKHVDLIFLDVEMPNMSGLEFLRAFRDLPPVILVTSKKEYSFDAFENDVIDFLLKPFEYARFLRAAEKVLATTSTAAMTNAESMPESEPERDHIFVKVDQSMKKLMLDDILHLEAMGDFVRIHLTEERATIFSTMNAIEAELPPEQFMRVHRSHIVNTNLITRVEEGSTIFIGDQKVPLSRSKKDALKKRIGLFEKPNG